MVADVDQMSGPKSSWSYLELTFPKNFDNKNLKKSSDGNNNIVGDLIGDINVASVLGIDDKKKSSSLKKKGALAVLPESAEKLREQCPSVKTDCSFRILFCLKKSSIFLLRFI